MSAVVTVGNFSTDTGQLKNASSFFADMLPFFTKRALTYVDVGAYQAGVFSEILQSGLRIREAHLIEPNPRSFAAAREQVGKLKTQHSVDFYNVAIGARAGRVKLHDAGTMTKVLDDKAVAATLGMDESSAIEVDCTTLDALAQNITERHISLLKIDVEGQEIEALTGAKNLLKEERVDVIYIEAGINPKGTQQCYYRRIEDFLRKYGYGLFRIYEQHNEWMEDSPLLRRVNLAFMSRRFAQSNPYRLTKDLHRANERLDSLQQKIDYSASQIASLERTSKDAQSKLQAALTERDEIKLALAAVETKAQTALTEMQAAMAEHEAFKKVLSHTEATATTLSGEVEKITKERDSLEHILSVTQKNHAALVAEQQALVTSLQQANGALERSVAEAEKARDALQEKQQALASEHQQTTATLERRLAEVEKARDAVLAEQQTIATQHRQATDTFERRLAEAEEARDALLAEQQTMAAQHKQATDTFERLLAEAEEARDALLAEQQTMAAQHKQATNTFERHLAEAEEARDALLAEQQTMAAQHKQATDTFERRLAEAEKDRDALLAEQRAIAAQHKETIDTFERRLTEAGAVCDALLAEQQALKAEHRGALEALERRLKEAEKAHSALLTEQQALTAEHNRAKAALQDLEQAAAASQRELGELQHRIQVTESELATVAAQRDSLQAAMALAEAHATAQSSQLAALTSEREEIETALAHSKQSNDVLRDDLRAATAERNELAAKIEEAAARVAEANERRDALLGTLAQAEQTSSTLSATLEALVSERQDLARALAQSQLAQSNQEADLQNVTAERDSIKASLEQAAKAATSMQERLEASRQSNEMLDQRITEAQRQLEHADHQRDALHLELARAEESSLALTEKLGRLSDDRRALELMLSDSYASRNQLSAELERVSAERDGIEATRTTECEILKAALVKAEGHAGTLTASIEQLSAEHRALAVSLDASQNARRTLSTELEIVTAARDQLKASLQQAEVAASRLSAEAKALAAERRDLRDAMKNVESTAESYRKSLAGSEQANRKLADKVNSAQSKASVLAKQCQSLKESLAQAEQEIGKLSEKNALISAKRDSLKTNLEKSRSEKDRLANKLLSATNDCGSMKEKLRNAEKIVDAYQQDLEASQLTSQGLQQTLRDVFESTAQLHRRELRAWKELRRLRSKLNGAEGSSEASTSGTAEEAAAPSVIKFSSDTNTVYVPLTLSRHTIVVPSSNGGHLIRMTYLAEPSASATVEVTLRAEQNLQHVISVGNEKLIEGNESVIRQIDIRPGTSIRLLELDPAGGEVKFELRRARGYFGMLKLEQTSSVQEAPAPVKHKKSKVALLANLLGTGTTVPTVDLSAPQAAFSSHELSHKLWGGYARYAIPELERLKLDARAALADREAAAWYLTQWFAVEGEFSRAIENIHFSKNLVRKIRQKFVLAEVQCLIQLGRFSQALAVLDHAIESKPLLDYHLLRSTVIRNLGITKGSSPEQVEQAQIDALNVVFCKAGVAPLEKRSAHLPLTLSNITARAKATTAEQRQKLSIVIPAFNAGETIEWVLQSLLEQTWRNLEIIVVDDVSSDNTADIVEAVSRRDGRVRLLRQSTNSGAYASRNAGVRAATGDYLMVHDSDDWSHPQRIEMQIEALHANPKCVAVKSYWVRVSNNIEILGAWVPKQSLLDLNYSSLLFRRDLMERTGLWDEVSVGGDAEFYARLRALYGEESVLKICEDTPLALALTREDSLTRSKATHLKSNYYGLRWNYIDSCRFWHTRLQQQQTHAGLTSKTMALPFAAPLGNRPKKGAVPRYDVVVMADLAAEGASLDGTLHYLRAAANAGLKVGVFHWRQYELPTRAPLQAAFYETRLQYAIDVLSPGDTADAGLVLFTQPEILHHRIDPMPTVRATQVAVIVDHAVQCDPLLARTHVQSIFGVDGLWIAVTDQAIALMHSDKRYPAPSPATCLPM